jgi:hypothetical protein
MRGGQGTVTEPGLIVVIQNGAVTARSSSPIVQVTPAPALPEQPKLIVPGKSEPVEEGVFKPFID